MFPPGFTCPAVLWILLTIVGCRIQGSHLLWPAFPCRFPNLSLYVAVQTPKIPKDSRFGLFRVRSPLLAESRLMSFPRPTQMFQFRRFPTYTYFIQCTLTEYCSAGFPHSEICGSQLMCSSPQLIAACRVLHRLLMPRHSPCALYSLTYQNNLRWFSQFLNYAGT